MMRRAEVVYFAPAPGPQGLKGERGYYVVVGRREERVAGPFNSEKDAIRYATRNGFDVQS